jgi:DHA1 family tetracycline resistance protein-like MFS transporter
MQKNVLGIVFFTVFLDLLGFGMIIPIQPFYVESFGASASTITLLGASYSLMQFICSPLWGKLSDQIGRRTVILYSTILVAIGHFAFALAPTLLFLFLARILSGAGSANIGAAQAMIADITTQENRAKGMGIIGAAFGLGFLLGPAMGGLLVQYGNHLPMVVAGILSLLNYVFALLYLPETLKRDSLNKSDQLVQSTKQSDLKSSFWRFQNVYELMGISLIFTLAFAMMEQTIGLFVKEVWVDPSLSMDLKLKQSAKLTAYFLVVVGLVASIIQGGLIGRLTKRYGEILLCRIGLILVAISIGMIPFVGKTQVYLLLLCTSFVMASGTGLLNPSRNSLLSKGVDAKIQGLAMGWSHALSALGRVIGPAMAGWVFEQNMRYPFWLASLLMCIPIYWSFRLKPLK